MPIEQIISSDAWLLTQEPLGTVVTETHSTITGGFSVTGIVDHVSGNGVAGIYIASGEFLGLRTFSALVIDQSGTVSVFQGTMTDDAGVLSLSSAVEVSVTNGGMGVFPNYMSYSGTTWRYTHSGGQGIATDTSVAAPEIGGILLFRKPGDSADLSTLAQIGTHRVLSGSIDFPNQDSSFADVVAVTDSGDISSLLSTQLPVIHGIVGAPFGALDLDIGKSVPWTSNFVNDLFITDTNSGDPRYWVTEWVKRNQKSKAISLGKDYFSDPVEWRKAQFAAADAAWGYSNDDWVLFVDATEGLSCDTRTLPNDVTIDPFKSYIHTEIARAVTTGLSFASIPFFAFVRNADIPDSRRFLQLADPADVQDWLQQRGSTLSVDEVNISVVEAATPYYYQQQDVSKRGLVRLIKVSTLRSVGFDWSSIDTLSVPHDNVGIQIISYAYASWINPATGEDDGLKMRSKISTVRPLVGMPSGGGGATGTAGPYTVAENGVLTQVTPSSTQTQPLLTPLYPMLFRSNIRFGTWYPPGVLAPDPIKPPYAFSFPPPAGRGEALLALAQVNNGEDLLFAGASTGSGTAYNASPVIDYSPAANSASFWLDSRLSAVSSGALTNLGSAGSGLNARFGSTTGVDSFDPVLLAHTGTNYLYLPGSSTATNYASVPYISAYDLTGDSEFVFRFRCDDLGSGRLLLAHPFSTNGYYISVTATGQINLTFCVAATPTTLSASSSTAGVVVAGTTMWAKITRNATTGLVSHYTAADQATEPTVWTAQGTGSPSAGPFATNTGILGIGGNSSTSNMVGGMYRAIVRDGIGGSTVFDADFTTGITSGGQTTFTESSVNAATVTINRSSSGRKSVAVTRPVLLFGTDDYMEVAANPYDTYVTTTTASTSGISTTHTTFDSGTATAGAATTLDDTTKVWTAGEFTSRVVRITGGTGSGQVRVISTNTATQLTVTTAWTTAPNATSTYVIESRGNVEGDIQIVVRCALNNWANGANQPLVEKRVAGQASYYFYMNPTGIPGFTYTTDGSTSITVAGVTVAPFTNGTAYWIRFRRTASTGAWQFDYAADQTTEPALWTSLSSGTGTAGLIWKGTANVTVSYSALAVLYTAGRFYNAKVNDGFAGNAVVYWNSYGHPTADSYVNGNRVLWNLGASSTVVNPHPLNFSDSQSFTIVTVHRQWATAVASGTHISKWAGGGGWNVRNGFATPTSPLIALNNETTAQNAAGPNPTLGDVVVLSWVVTPTTITPYANNTVYGTATRTQFNSAASHEVVRIGTTSANTVPVDFELLGAAVFPKALTAGEVSNLVTYYS